MFWRTYVAYQLYNLNWKAEDVHGWEEVVVSRVTTCDSLNLPLAVDPYDIIYRQINMAAGHGLD